MRETNALGWKSARINGNLEAEKWRSMQNPVASESSQINNFPVRN